MPIVRGNQAADIQIAVSAEMDKASMKQVHDAIKSMAAEERTAIEDQIKGERLLAQVESERAKKLQEMAAKQTAAAKAQIDAQNQYRAGLMKTKETAQQLASIANSVSAAGLAMMAPFVASAAKFVTSASKGDAVAKQYRESMSSLEDSTNRIGRVTTDVLNPALKGTADIMRDIAGFVEKNPDAIKTFLAVGGTLAVGGKIAAGALTLSSQMATIKLAQMAASGGAAAVGQAAAAGGATAAGAAAGGGIAAIATAAAPVVITALLAAGIIALAVAASKNAPDLTPEQKAAFQPGSGFVKGKWSNDFSTRDYSQPYGPPDIRKPYGPPRPGYGQYGGLIGPAVPTESGNAIAQAVADKEAERLEAEKEAAKKRLDATKDFEAKRASIEKSMAEATHTYLEADRRAHQDYYNSRRDYTKQAGVDIERAEQDHQRNIQKIQRDSQARIYGMVQERDALGIVQEKRNAETQRQEAEENYRIEIGRKNEDVAERLRIMDREFSLTNERRLADFQYSISLKNAEVAAAQQTYDAIVNMGVNAVNRINELAVLAGAASGAGKEQPPGTRRPGERYENGGDVAKTGPAIVHKGELVVSRPYRQMAENLIGGSLSQSGLLDLARNAGNRTTFNNNFGNTVTIQQVSQMIDASSRSLLQQLDRSLQPS